MFMLGSPDTVYVRVSLRRIGLRNVLDKSSDVYTVQLLNTDVPFGGLENITNDKEKFFDVRLWLQCIKSRCGQMLTSAFKEEKICAGAFLESVRGLQLRDKASYQFEIDKENYELNLQVR